MNDVTVVGMGGMNKYNERYTNENIWRDRESNPGPLHH